MNQLTLPLDFSRCQPIREPAAEPVSLLEALATFHAWWDVTFSHYGELYETAKQRMEQKPQPA